MCGSSIATRAACSASRSRSQDEGDAFHAAALAKGGTAIEDPPGLRKGGYYIAYVRDPDGHKLCAIHYPAARG